MKVSSKILLLALFIQADAAGQSKGEKKREKTSTSSKENDQGAKRDKKRVSVL